MMQPFHAIGHGITSFMYHVSSAAGNTYLCPDGLYEFPCVAVTSNHTGCCKQQTFFSQLQRLLIREVAVGRTVLPEGSFLGI